MILKESLLKFENFTVLNTVCHYNHGEDITREQLYSYPIDIDFDILGHQEEQMFKIVVSVKLNGENMPGYTVSALAATFFRINGDVSEAERNGLLQYSGLQMAIANLRAYIESITYCYPLGKYTLPTIDLNDMLSQKAQITVERNSNNN